eukprot:CAMPEP_0177756472 /NCGR_PEP_ID=MMETSP0491_2-20121128/3124_1 /TAXON_ID=63592 /ORGANISM="Tetraselmis chuii, Strain PLY429" /LENGTH=364 /DNA_ID=CAMNT_0019272051 /DNA_START=276 /DNA_END=1370 /DNA_ORIENTATION=+
MSSLFASRESTSRGAEGPTTLEDGHGSRHHSVGYVPVLDIGSFCVGQPRSYDGHAQLCNDVEQALGTAGFFVVTGHSVPVEAIDTAKKVCRQFFDQSEQQKARIAHMKKGYIPVGGCANQVRPSALHEKWSCGRVDGIDSSHAYYQNADYFGEPNLWPDKPEEFKHAMTRYYKEMETLVRRLLALVATVLEMEAEYFESAMDRHVTNLVALRYPPQPQQPSEGEMRAKPHTDPTVLTILTHDKLPGSSSGLEVLHGTNSDQWEPVPVVEGGLVVNAGDLLTRWSNGRLRSAKHRVVNGDDDRLAISFFAMPAYDTPVAPLPGCVKLGEEGRYETILAGDISHFKQLEREKHGLLDPQVLENQTS